MVLHYVFQVDVEVKLLDYHNPSDHKSDDTACDVGDMCDIVMFMCISSVSTPG